MVARENEPTVVFSHHVIRTKQPDSHFLCKITGRHTKRRLIRQVIETSSKIAQPAFKFATVKRRGTGFPDCELNHDVLSICVCVSDKICCSGMERNARSCRFPMPTNSLMIWMFLISAAVPAINVVQNTIAAMTRARYEFNTHHRRGHQDRNELAMPSTLARLANGLHSCESDFSTSPAVVTTPAAAAHSA